MHLMMCRLCSRHKRQLEMLRRFMDHYADRLQQAEPAARLSPDVKAKLKQALQDASQ